MPIYERLREEDRSSRFTVADAIDVLDLDTSFSEHHEAVVVVGLMQLPSEKWFGIVQITYNEFEFKHYVVSMPSSTHFTAKRPGSSVSETFEISELDNARVRGDGSVLLENGVRFRAIELVRARLPIEPTQLDQRIVHLAVKIAGAEKQCYRSLRDGVRLRYREMVPEIWFLDGSKLRGVDLPPLKVLLGRIADLDPTLKRLSPQKLADTLHMYGMRTPTPRPRRKARQSCATI